MKIVLFVRGLNDPYQYTIYQAVFTLAKKLGVELLTIQDETISLERMQSGNCFKHLKFFKADGVLLLSSTMLMDFAITANDIKKALDNLPCVSIGYNFDGIPSILIRNRNSMEKIIRHLVEEHGYQKILYIGGVAEHHDNVIRENVFVKMMQEYKEMGKDMQYTIAHCDWGEHVSYVFIKQYIDEHQQEAPDVIIAANDAMAIGVKKYLRTLIGSAWQKCAITGFDNLPGSASSDLALTTVAQPLEEMGETGLKILWNCINGNKVDEKVYIDTKVIFRNSCGCSAFTSLPYKNEELKKNALSQYKSQYGWEVLSLFTQELTNTNTRDMLKKHLNFFLDQLEIKTFYLICYFNPNDFDNKTWKKTGRAILYYCRENNRQLCEKESKDIDLSIFFAEKSESINPCIKQLYFDEVEVGFCFYDAGEYAQPHICSAITFIENTMRRIQILNREKDKAQRFEHEVLERTKDLRLANKKLKKEANRRLAVEAEVLRISELERLRFSIDLHDDICQRLAGISMYCNSLISNNTPLAVESTKELASLIDETLTRTRSYAHDCFPLEIDSHSLNDALSGLCASVEKQSGIHFVYNANVPKNLKLSKIKKINIYRIMQEAVHNVASHSKATEAELCASIIDDKLCIKLIDNGIGLKKSSIRPSKKQKKSCGIGLRSMEYRAHQIDAEYKLCSKDSGTSVLLSVPLRDKKDCKE